jgi:hypothetical protein
MGHSDRDPAAPSPEEAAAIVAAVERFLRDHAAPVPAAPGRADAWRRAALLEGVCREPSAASERHPWINT